MRYRGDITGGLTAAVVALPLALAFGIASGAGAVAGLYASVFGGLAAGVFGGCGVQITGPTGAMTAVLVAVVAKYGVSGMFLAGALAGLMQIVFGLLRLGKFVKYLPQPVIAGFTNGVSILFFLTAVGDAFNEPLITAITVIVIVLALRFCKGMPESLFGLAAGLLVNELLLNSPHIVGDIPFTVPKLTIGIMPFEHIGPLLMPAFTIFLLGSISALLSAEVTDGMLGVKSSSNRELIGQGLGNMISSILGGVPVSGAVARSGVNVHSGGRTRVSGILHAVFLLLIIVFLGPVAKRIPLATLAGILMVASVRTADWKSLKLVPRARWTYGIIMTVTTVLTVVKDLSVAVIVGVVLAGIAVLVELAVSTQLSDMSASTSKSKKTVDLKSKLVSEYPDNVQVIALEGPLFFVGMEGLRTQLGELTEKDIVVLDFSRVPTADETAVLALTDLVQRMQKQGTTVYIAGLNRKTLRMFTRMNVVKRLGRSRVFKGLKGPLRHISQVNV